MRYPTALIFIQLFDDGRCGLKSLNIVLNITIVQESKEDLILRYSSSFFVCCEHAGQQGDAVVLVDVIIWGGAAVSDPTVHRHGQKKGACSKITIFKDFLLFIRLCIFMHTSTLADRWQIIGSSWISSSWFQMLMIQKCVFKHCLSLRELLALKCLIELPRS